MTHTARDSGAQGSLTVFRERAVDVLTETGIALSNEERKQIEVVDFGLGRFEETGLAILTYVNTKRCCAKEMVLLPGQTCAEHRHPAYDGAPGKEETFRVRRGTVYLYVPGKPAAEPRCTPYRPEHYTAWHEIVLGPGQQYTILPDIRHWFHAPHGAVVSEFSTHSRDHLDIFTDPAIVRMPEKE